MKPLPLIASMKHKLSRQPDAPYLRGVLPSLCAALLSGLLLTTATYAAPIVTVTNPTAGQVVAQSPTATEGSSAPTDPNAAASEGSAINPNSLAAQLQPDDNALSAANQELLSRNAKLQREVNDLQTQVNVLIYESKGQMFLYGAFTVLISLLVGIFVSWLVFVRRQRW